MQEKITLSHYHIKKSVEMLHMLKKSSTFAPKLSKTKISVLHL